ncbi:MAG: hypothetical protein MRECE_9c042 [Mycoplasmataceae bacterium CE_OT135]|nr:MAG: hypothetical protein MRECE_9c042 [Mycoplasmataceae bacterium CE_OT135]
MFWAFLAKAVPWIIGGLVTYFTAKPLIEKWGSTPAIRAESLGIPRERLHNDYQEYRRDKTKYLKERNEENNKHLLDELDKLKEKLDKLEKQKVKQAEEVQAESDPQEKAKKVAVMKETEKEISNVKKEIKEKEKQIESNNKELEKVFADLSKGSPAVISEEQLVARSKAPDLGAWKNWGIIAFCVVIGIIIVKVVYGLLSKLTKGVGD